MRRSRKAGIVCTPVSLPPADQVAAAIQAIATNPVNRPPVEQLAAQFLPMLAIGGDQPADPGYLSVLTTKYWGANGVRLTVGFLEPCPADLRNRILSYLNLWSECCNARFAWTQTDPQVRISRETDGYWSYLGTDLLSIPRNKPTMSLQGITMRTPDRECMRVIPHEGGHSLGFPHEHMRREFVRRIDPRKAYPFYERTQGWSKAMVDSQVLTPLEESSLLGTEHADEHSIMSYSVPGEITFDGKPILGGTEIDSEDRAFALKVYPLRGAPAGDWREVRVRVRGEVEVIGPA